MAILSIITAPDPRLKIVSAPVEQVDSELRKLMDDMLETMYAAPGIGLSAIQVGVPKRVIVVDVTSEGKTRAPLRLVNPEIVWTGSETVNYEEGCLSLPEQYAEVERAAAIRVRYLDDNGAPREIAVETLLATCIQHEMDHLDGILFVDHLSAVRRSIILRKLAKARRTKALKSA
ncbi:MAG: peptide deformylase [Alphaproteobacteria bacterium]